MLSAPLTLPQITSSYSSLESRRPKTSLEIPFVAGLYMHCLLSQVTVVKQKTFFFLQSCLEIFKVIQACFSIFCVGLEGKFDFNGVRSHRCSNNLQSIGRNYWRGQLKGINHPLHFGWSSWVGLGNCSFCEDMLDSTHRFSHLQSDENQESTKIKWSIRIMSKY